MSSPKLPSASTLYYGDNLEILQEYIADESIDLIYLDPPFNSNRNYNVLFKNESGKEAQAQIVAFEDTWHWGEETERAYQELLIDGPQRVTAMIANLLQFIGRNQMMAYLVMMTIRLVELHRVLKSTGSLYLHCDPTASHYLKVILDTIFGPDKFRSEIVWKRTHAHNSAKRWGPVHDTIFFYSKTNTYTWNSIRQGYSQEYIERYFKFDDSDGRGPYWTGDITGSGIRHGETGAVWRGFNPTQKGRHWAYPPKVLDELDTDRRIFWPKTSGAWPKLKRYLSEAKGIPVQDMILDIDSMVTMGSNKAERLGYPTQKPLALLERIIQTSSNPGNLILDPFCGCGTAVTAAEKLGRRWIGIDITHLAISLITYRLKDAFPSVQFNVEGVPKDLESAYMLARDNRFEFQWWALHLIHACPYGGDVGSRVGKKGADRGVDGFINFIDDGGKPKFILVQVKSGRVSSRDIRDLAGAMERERAPMGVFLTLEPASKPMETEAVAAGFYLSPFTGETYPRIQIVTVGDLLSGHAQLKLPPQYGTFKQAQRIKKKEGVQGTLI